MLKTDFNGYKEFKEKLANTSGEENAKVCMERIQMWTNKFTDMINPLPAGAVGIGDRSFRNYSENTSRRTRRRELSC